MFQLCALTRDGKNSNWQFGLIVVTFGEDVRVRIARFLYESSGYSLWWLLRPESRFLVMLGLSSCEKKENLSNLLRNWHNQPNRTPSVYVQCTFFHRFQIWLNSSPLPVAYDVQSNSIIASKKGSRTIDLVFDVHRWSLQLQTVVTSLSPHIHLNYASSYLYRQWYTEKVFIYVSAPH